MNSDDNNYSDIIDEIFDRAIYGPKIFKNKLVLFHDYIPKRLLFREEQISKLARHLTTLIKHQRTSNLFIYGKPGTGKTAVTRYVINRLLEKIKGTDFKFIFSYVNCRLAGTEYRVIKYMADSIGLKLPFTGLSTEEAFNRLKNHLVNLKKPFLVVLDEVDALIIRYGDNLLYSLTRLNYDESDIIAMIIGISNDLRFKEMLDPRVLSSLSEEEIIFKPYTATELEQILWDRIQLAFFDNTVDQGAVKLAAAISGSENGDARKALDLIRVAGEIVEAQGGNKITTDHIKMAYNSIDRERTLEVIRTLPLHSKLIIGALYLMTIGGQNNRIKSSVLYQKYSLLTGEIGESPLSSRRFYSLLTELSLLGIVNRRIDNYGRRGGRVTTVKFDVPLTLIKKSLVEDPIIGDLLINKFD